MYPTSLYIKQQQLLEAMSSSKIEGANDYGMIKKAEKLDVMDWFHELNKTFPELYKAVFKK